MKLLRIKFCSLGISVKGLSINDVTLFLDNFYFHPKLIRGSNIATKIVGKRTNFGKKTNKHILK